MAAAPLALLAAAIFGGADFLGGIATKKASAWAVTFLAHTTGAVLIVLMYLVVGGTWTTGAVLWGVIGGFAGTLALVLLLDALASGYFQLVSPLSAVTGSLIPVVVGLVSGDRPGTLGLLGLAITPPAVWLLTTGSADREEARDPAPLVKAVLAGIGFGLFFVAMDQTPDDSGAVPLLAARFSSVPFLGIVAAFTTGSVLPSAHRPTAVGSGALDMTANALFLLATRSGQLAVVGALVALYPASNALLARLFLGETLHNAQRLGFVLTIGAAALLSV